MEIIKICKYCNTEFSQPKSKYLKKYCSKECRYKHHSEIIKNIESNRTSEFYKERYQKTIETCKRKYNRSSAVNPEKLKETLKSKPKEFWDSRENLAKITKIQKYNDPNFRNYQKSKNTKLERYGNENYNNPEKNKSTRLERYGCYYTNSDKANKTKIEKYGSLSVLTERAINTYKERTGKAHFSHRNIINYHNFNPEYIKENFIFEDYIDYKGFGEYFNIKNAADYLRKHFKVKPQKNTSHCEKMFLEKIGNCETQKKIFSYFVDGFKDGIVYEFLGDFWHGNPNVFNLNDINPYLKESYGSLYQKTFKRFDKILEHPDVKEIRYLWESDFKLNNFMESIKIYKGSKNLQTTEKYGNYGICE